VFLTAVEAAKCKPVWASSSFRTSNLAPAAF